VDALIRACGWRQKEWPQRFGFSVGTLGRVLYGCRPRMALVRRLVRLETMYELELKALSAGLIQVVGRRRYDWRDRADFGRPADLRNLESVTLRPRG